MKPSLVDSRLLKSYRRRRLWARLTLATQMPSVPPVVIGAMGGSGTRALVKLFRLAGIWMGDWTDTRTEDALAMRAYLATWFESVCDAILKGHAPPISAEREFRLAISAHRLHCPRTLMQWGWKNPRNMWLIPFYARFFPKMKFIHIIRDGRDMALSENQFLLNSHGDALLDPVLRQNPLQAQLWLWQLGNMHAKLSAEQVLAPGHYLPMRYEDLCLAPDDSIRRILDFLGIPDDRSLAAEGAALIKPSMRIGAWQASPKQELHHPAAEVVTALRTFGYVR